VKQLKKGEKTALIEALAQEDNELQGESGLQKVLKDMPEPKTEEIHVLVAVPKQDPTAATHQIFTSYQPHAEGINLQLPHLPITTVLHEPDKYAKECISLRTWGVDAVHEIPLIQKFMSSLGGCTSNGKIFWRLEDKQVVSILVDGWFRESTPGNINVRANKKSILMGSPGIGKSTLLCVMATNIA
jgi:hypothetical protein